MERARARLSGLASEAASTLAQRLFDLLADDAQAPDDALPATGVPLEWERLLSSAFIRSAGYGTRCSTVILVSAGGEVRFEERTFSAAHALAGQRVETFELVRSDS